MRAAIAAISPIAKGKLDKAANTLLGNLLTNPITPLLLSTSPETSSFFNGGGDESEKTIFLDTLSFFFLTSWEVLSLQEIVKERVMHLLKRVWSWGLNVE